MAWRVPTEARSARVFPAPLRGRVEVHRFESRRLEGNPLGDPTERDLPVYLPPSGTTEGRPLLLLLSGFSGAGWWHFQRPRYLNESLVHRFDRLIGSGAAPEAVLAAPDCLTTLGGSQYLDSSATGPYERYVVDEVLPWLHERYRTGPVVALGTSSGGYGALVLALRHPDRIRAAAANAPDSYFEYCYPPDFPRAFREIHRAGGPEAFLRRTFGEPVSNFGPWSPTAPAVSTIAYASCYSPRDSEPGRFDLPFDLDTGELRDEVWRRWLAWDPVRIVATEDGRSAARRLRYLYVDGGSGDEFGLDIGARVFAARARRAGATLDLELFDAGHFDSGPRYDVMFPRLLRAVTTEPPGRESAPV